MSNPQDLVGCRFNNLVVISYDHSKKSRGGHSARYWKCKCDCGNEIVLRYDILKYRKNRSCGCQSRKCGKIGSEHPLWKGCGKISSTYFRKVQSNARTRHFTFDVDLEYLWDLFTKQNGKCVLTGLPLTFNSREWTADGSASLDRIDAKVGYVKGNLQWIHKDVNRMKQHFGEDYFVQMCEKVADYKRT